MTYEMAVARAFLNVVQSGPYNIKCYYPGSGDYTLRTYALRRLRVRAGLVP